MPVERDGNFITLSAGGEAIKLPFAAYESGKQTIATVVDQGRTVDGIVRGSVVAKATKIELKWAVLSPEAWADICSFFKQFIRFVFVLFYSLTAKITGCEIAHCLSVSHLGSFII